MKKKYLPYILIIFFLLSFVLILGLTKKVKEETKPINQIVEQVTPPQEDSSMELPEAIKDKIKIYVFHGNGCPHCSKLIAFLNDIEKTYGVYFELIKYEIYDNEENLDLLNKTAALLNINVTSVPFYLIGETYFKGYSASKNEE
ncbi:MAG: thioredoxin family protein, partial [Bacilli bacterium]